MVKSEEAVSKKLCEILPSEMGSTLKTGAAFLQNQAFVWEKKEISQQAKQLQKNSNKKNSYTEWAQISAPAKYEEVGTIQKLLMQIFTIGTKK